MPVQDFPIQPEDQLDVAKIFNEMKRLRPQLIGPDGAVHELSANVSAFLARLLADLSEGKSVSIVQANHQLTTVEAAKLLGMSRQFLITLLEKNELPYHMVGTHRRLYFRDVVAYKSRRDAARRKALNDLALAEMEEGLYDRMPDVSDERQ